MFCRLVFGNISGGFRGISRFFGNFAGFRGNTWISQVRHCAKYQKPCTWPDIYLRKTLYFSVSRRNIELKTSKHEFTDRSHQNKQGFEDKKFSGTEFTAFQEYFVPDIADSGNWTQTFLLFSYLGFRVCFTCYPPESFKITCLTCIWLKFVNTSFHSTQNPRQLHPTSDRHFSKFLQNRCVKLKTLRGLELGT